MRRAAAVLMVTAALLAPPGTARAGEATASAGDTGFGLRSADGGFEFRFRGLLQADARFFAGDEQAFNDGFLVRRLEPSFEVTLGELAYFKLQPQFAGDTTTTSDVFGELRFDPAATLRFGKFKTPLALEYLQSSSALALVERGLPAEVGAGRDFGVQLHGQTSGGAVSYAIAWVNGAPDGRDAGSSDTDSHKELAARLFFEPVRNLGFGVAATTGRKAGTTTTAGTGASAATAAFNNTLPRYRSPGQNTIFSYRSAATPTDADTVTAAGDHLRWSPQVYFYRGGLGLLSEYMVSRQEVSLAGAADELEHRAYQLVVSYVLTGEAASYRGVRPATPYVRGSGGWGAFEVAVRYGTLDVDNDAFPVYANPDSAVSRATNTGIGLAWSLNANVRLALDCNRTAFDGGAAGGADRDDETAVFTRAQLSF